MGYDDDELNIWRLCPLLGSAGPLAFGFFGRKRATHCHDSRNRDDVKLGCDANVTSSEAKVT